jgi:hypothetical protein
MTDLMQQALELADMAKAAARQLGARANIHRAGTQIRYTIEDAAWDELAAQFIRAALTPPTREDGERVAKACDWPADGRFTFVDEPGAHDPCYVVMPGGAMLPLNHHNGEGVDIARAKFIIAACNAALSAMPPPPEAVLEFYANAWEQDVDAERTVSGWEGSIGEMMPNEELLADKGERARQALAAYRESRK